MQIRFVGVIGPHQHGKTCPCRVPSTGPSRRTADGRSEGMSPTSAHFLDELRRLEHDVLHQLSTIAMLAELLAEPDISEPTRQLRARQMMGEIRWLRRLVRDAQSRSSGTCAATGAFTEVPLHELVAEVVATARLM